MSTTQWKRKVPFISLPLFLWGQMAVYMWNRPHLTGTWANVIQMLCPIAPCSMHSNLYGTGLKLIAKLSTCAGANSQIHREGAGLNIRERTGGKLGFPLDSDSIIMSFKGLFTKYCVLTGSQWPLAFLLLPMTNAEENFYLTTVLCYKNLRTSTLNRNPAFTLFC